MDFAKSRVKFEMKKWLRWRGLDQNLSEWLSEVTTKFLNIYIGFKLTTDTIWYY